MKALLALALFIVVVIVAVYFAGGFAGFDPAAEAAAFKKSLTPGMMWDKIADTKAPQKVLIVPTQPEGESSPLQGMVTIDFDRGTVENGVKGRRYADGFAFRYVFSADETFLLWFDVEGKLTSVEADDAVKNLLKGKLPGQN